MTTAQSNPATPPDPAQSREPASADPARERKVLIVEDEADVAGLLRFNLEREGYQCHIVASGDAARTALARIAPDLVILDRMLPGLSGDDVAARIRRDPRTSTVPIIMLTAKGEESDQLVGFALGADDYITKPFSMKLLMARVAAMLRRTDRSDADPDVLVAGPIKLVPGRHQVSVDGTEVALTATEFRLLKVLMASNGRVRDRGQLIDSVIGTGVAVTDRTIDVHVTSLRKKLGPAAAWLQTVRGVGYTLRKPADIRGK